MMTKWRVLYYIYLLSAFLYLVCRLLYSSVKITPLAIHLQFGKNYEFVRYEARKYTTYFAKSQFFDHLQDEKALMINTYNNIYIPETDCSQSKDIAYFFYINKEKLFKPCTDFRAFSHCQPHYIFQYDTSTKQCHSYFHESYMNMPYSGVTLTLPLTINRMDRLPLHFNRWRGDMSIVLQVNEEEMEFLVDLLDTIKRPRIRFTFYIVQTPRKGDFRCTFQSMTNVKVQYTSCFVINVLRNLAIETIKTTHFLIVDGDGIISSTLEENLSHYRNVLKNEKMILLLPLFPYSTPDHRACIIDGDCIDTWRKLPKTKKELLKNYNNVKEIKKGHRIVNIKSWKNSKSNELLKVRQVRAMEPYGIFKRTRKLPLFHPYFINYGGNKENYYYVLNTMHYEYHVLPQDFSIDIPHPKSNYKDSMKTGKNSAYASELFFYFKHMYNTYCRQNTCNLFQLQTIDWSRFRMIRRVKF